MAILNKTVILGAHISFVRNGIDDTGTPVSATHLPAPASVLFEDLGAVETADITNKVDSLRLKAPASGGGRYRLRQTIPLGQELTVKAMMQQVNQLTYETMFMLASALVVGTAQQPMKQGAPVTGWLYIKSFDQADVLTLEQYLYVELSCKQIKFAEKEYKTELDFEVLDNVLATVKVNSLS